MARKKRRKKKKKLDPVKAAKAAARKAALKNGEAWMPKRTLVFPDPQKEEERTICRRRVDPEEDQ